MLRGGVAITPGAMRWKNRWIGNPLLSTICRAFFNCPAQDFHCRLRGFRKAAYEKMELKTASRKPPTEVEKAY